MKKYFHFGKEILKSFKEGSFSLLFCECPVCDSKKFFIRAGFENHLIKCLSCRHSIISLSLIKSLMTYKISINFDRTYELSFHGAVFDFLKKRSKKFYFSEFFSSSNALYVNGVRNEDVQNLSFENNFFDLITCTEVLEHVPEYKRGLKEFNRVLRKGGHLFFTVPLFNNPKTIQVAQLVKNKIRWIISPEFHGSRITGPNSVPVFWRHAKKQITKDLRESGFSSAELIEIDWGRGISQIIVHGIK
jgi:SAM-dependent methyltransferase